MWEAAAVLLNMTTVYMLPVELYEKLKVLVKTGKIEEITSYLD